MSTQEKHTHTPGPWRVIETKTLPISIACPTFWMARLRDDAGSREQQLANAHLIAAAPELLAALERFAEHVKRGNYPELQGVACDAFAAIAKARGQQH